MESVWKMLAEDFDSNLPRLTAVYVRESDGTIGFAYPSGENCAGFVFEHSIRTGYDMPPKFHFDFAAYEQRADGLHKNRALFTRQTFLPSLIRRRLEYTNLPLVGCERFGRFTEGALSWIFDFTCRTEWFRFEEDLISVVRSDEKFSASMDGDVLTLQFDDIAYYIAASQPFSAAVYRDERELKREAAGKAADRAEKGYLLALRQSFSMASLQRAQFVIGISTVSPQKAKEAAGVLNNAGQSDPDEALALLEGRIAAVWDQWFESLPVVDLRDRQELRAYYKCWAVIKNNYYDHPRWGHSIMESLPVYKGIWQWATPAVEWYSDQNTDYTSQWIEKAMDMLLAAQREDGYVTHAIYIDEEVPGSGWADSGTVQTPHLPWTALRHCYAIGSTELLRRWKPALEKYYRYLCTSRDTELENLHLWAIFSSFDTGLDTTSAFQRVTYGEPDHEKEKYCYPAIFGAERFRYELSMAEIEELLGGDGSSWRAEAEKTREAMNRVLWDEAAGWYGVRHEDKTLDTRVGLDGLFAILYGLPDEERLKKMEPGVCRLIGPYGVRTVAEGEPGFRADVYWRGACWPKACSVMLEVCRRYYPELAETVRDGLLRVVLRYPSVWECWNVETGELAHSDHGFYCTPGMTSNVGAGDLIASLWESHGLAMYSTKMALPAVPMKNFHHAGLRISIEKSGSRMIASARAAEKTEADVDFLVWKTRPKQAASQPADLVVRTVHLRAGNSVAL